MTPAKNKVPSNDPFGHEHPARVLGLFAKYWQPGNVKTRLAKTLGEKNAATIYREMLAFHLIRFQSSGSQRSIVYSPATEAVETQFTTLLGSLAIDLQWNLVPQIQSDLGTRMSTFFQQQFDAFEGKGRVMVIGSDAPQLTTEMVDEAFELLTSHDVVFGPSTDGGYYLIGLSVMAEEIFEGIAWSTDSVLDCSLQQCDAAGLSAVQLRPLDPLTDVDEEDDLHQVMELLRDDRCELSQRLLGDLKQVLGASS